MGTLYPWLLLLSGYSLFLTTHYYWILFIAGHTFSLATTSYWQHHFIGFSLYLVYSYFWLLSISDFSLFLSADICWLLLITDFTLLLAAPNYWLLFIACFYLLLANPQWWLLLISGFSLMLPITSCRRHSFRCLLIFIELWLFLDGSLKIRSVLRQHLKYFPCLHLHYFRKYDCWNMRTYLERFCKINFVKWNVEIREEFELRNPYLSVLNSFHIRPWICWSNDDAEVNAKGKVAT